MLLNSDKKFIKNYFNNPRAENGVYAWNLYADAAATRPVDGTGGTATNLALTSSSAAPLEGVRSLRLAKTGTASTQGKGFSTDLTIDTGLQGKMTQVRFDYRIVSGTFVGSGVNTTDSDLIVYFYDVTNSALIEPSCIVMDGTNTGLTFTYKGNVQIPTSCLSLRFIVHCATTSAVDYTLDFDNFSLSEQIAVQGAPVSDWINFTPTGLWTANTTYTGKWRRVGDTMEIRYRETFIGDPGSGSQLLYLPTGYTIDTSKLNSSTASNETLGRGHLHDPNGGTTRYQISAFYNSTTSVAIRYLTSNFSTVIYANADVTKSVPFTLGANVYLDILVTVPILGWSTSTSISGVDAADGRLVAFKAYRTAALTTLDPNNSTKVITWDTVEKDTHSAFSVADNKYYCPVSGYYIFNTAISLDGTNVLNSMYRGVVYVNGSPVEYGSIVVPEAGKAQQLIFSTFPIYCTAGTYVQTYIGGAGNNGTNKLTMDADATKSWFSGYRLPSTTSISSGETVACEYVSSNGQTIANASEQVVEFETKVYDTHGMVSGTGTSWVCKVPIAGKYLARAVIQYQSHALVAGDIFNFYLKKNGSTYVSTLVSKEVEANNTMVYGLSGCELINLVAGDYVTITAEQNHGAGLPLATSTTPYNNIFSLTRVGA